MKNTIVVVGMALAMVSCGGSSKSQAPKTSKPEPEVVKPAPQAPEKPELPEKPRVPEQSKQPPVPRPAPEAEKKPIAAPADTALIAQNLKAHIVPQDPQSDLPSKEASTESPWVWEGNHLLYVDTYRFKWDENGRFVPFYFLIPDVLLGDSVTEIQYYFSGRRQAERSEQIIQWKEAPFHQDLKSFAVNLGEAYSSDLFTGNGDESLVLVLKIQWKDQIFKIPVYLNLALQPTKLPHQYENLFVGSQAEARMEEGNLVVESDFIANRSKKPFALWVNTRSGFSAQYRVEVRGPKPFDDKPPTVKERNFVIRLNDLRVNELLVYRTFGDFADRTEESYDVKNSEWLRVPLNAGERVRLVWRMNAKNVPRCKIPRSIPKVIEWTEKGHMGLPEKKSTRASEDSSSMLYGLDGKFMVQIYYSDMSVVKKPSEFTQDLEDSRDGIAKYVDSRKSEFKFERRTKLEAGWNEYGCQGIPQIIR